LSIAILLYKFFDYCQLTELENYISTYLGISQSNLEKTASLFKKTELAKGEYFARIGERCDKLSFVQDGFIRIFGYSDKKEITQWISFKGYFVTDLNSLVFGQPSRRNIQALTDCTLYTLEGVDYRRMQEVVPDWPIMEKQFISSCFTTLEDRIFQHLSLSAEERYDRLFAFNRELFQYVPLQYLASMLGMSPETFSRIRAKKIS